MLISNKQFFSDPLLSSLPLINNILLLITFSSCDTRACYDVYTMCDIIIIILSFSVEIKTEERILEC